MDSTLLVGIIGAVGSVIAFIYGLGKKGALLETVKGLEKDVAVLKSENIRMTEALNRTYATEKFVKNGFVEKDSYIKDQTVEAKSRKDFEDKIYGKLESVEHISSLVLKALTGVKHGQ